MIFKIHILQTVDRRAIRRLYNGSMKCNWGITRPVAAIKSLRFALLKTTKFDILVDFLYAPQ